MEIHSAILDLFRDLHYRMMYENIASCRVIEKFMIIAGQAATVTQPFSDNDADA